MNKSIDNRRKYINVIILLILSFVLVTLFCKSSPIYIMCDLTDTNTWLIQAKQILQGYIPYKDIYEHKGPMQMFFYLFAALPCFKEFDGLYITEIILFSIFSIGVYKTSKLFGEKYNLTASVFSLIILALSESFSNTGSSEELLLPTFIFSFYIMVKYIKSEKEFKPIGIMLIGAMCAIRFWTKYNVCAFDFILVIYTIYWYVKNKWNIGKAILYYIIGFFAVTGPILIYFAINGALFDLFNIYFYTVLFKYTPDIKHSSTIFLFKLISCVPLLLALLAGKVKIYLKNNEDKFTVITFVAFALIIFITSAWWPYYFLNLYVFLIFFITKALNSNIKFSLIVLAVVVISTPLINGNQLVSLKYDKEDYGQLKMIELIEEKENPKVYIYNAENCGFYNYSDFMPFAEYFANYNIKLPEIDAEKDKIINEKEADFIITSKERDLEGYELISTEKIPVWNIFWMQSGTDKKSQFFIYYLYQRIEG